MTKMQLLVLCASLVAPARTEARQATRPAFSGPTTTPSGSYLDLSYLNRAPRRSPAPRPLVQARPTPLRAQTEGRPRVVCGMTIVPGHPAVDPGMTARVTPLGARPTIRTVEPTLCGDAASR